MSKDKNKVSGSTNKMDTTLLTIMEEQGAITSSGSQCFAAQEFGRFCHEKDHVDSTDAPLYAKAFMTVRAKRDGLKLSDASVKTLASAFVSFADSSVRESLNPYGFVAAWKAKNKTPKSMFQLYYSINRAIKAHVEEHGEQPKITLAFTTAALKPKAKESKDKNAPVSGTTNEPASVETATPEQEFAAVTTTLVTQAKAMLHNKACAKNKALKLALANLLKELALV